MYVSNTKDGACDGSRGRSIVSAAKRRRDSSLGRRGSFGLSRGFTLVELLVTIVLTAIVLAAMVPAFLSAHKASAGDRARNIAANVAQDRIEKIRLLPFDQIIDDADHLQSASFAGAQFGTTYTPPGSSKVYTIDYTVQNVPATGAVSYKRVEVTVAWTAPPSPVQPVTMRTIIMNPAVSGSPSPSPSSSPSPTPTPTLTPTPTPPTTTYKLTVLVNKDYVNPSLGVTVVRTDVTPNTTMPPAMQVPTTSSPKTWTGLPPGTYLITCNYYKKGNTNQPRTLQQTIYITNTDQTYTFQL